MYCSSKVNLRAAGIQRLAGRGNDVAVDIVSCYDCDVVRVHGIERYLSNVNRREFISGLLVAANCTAQSPAYPFVCPMDPEVRSAVPAKCPRCGMALIAGIPDGREFLVDLQLSPKLLRPGKPVRMRFVIRDSESGKPVRLQVMHEKLFHLFLVSQDLSFFAHEHPELQSDGSFVFRTMLPKSGEYRLLCDVYPERATPQMVAKSIVVPGPSPTPTLAVDLDPKPAQNVRVQLRLEPESPLVGKKTMMFFTLGPSDGLELYLGAWGHMLAASSDLIDMLHTHPAWEDVQRAVQFNLIFPRPGIYRVWVQFQRLGVVNTVAFNVPATAV